jgi:ketosteroid isomerase-like protein
VVLNRSRVALAVVVASVALLAYVILGGSDEDKILARLKELASAVETKTDETNIVLRTARINGVFKQALDPMVTFNAPELQTQRGIRELATLAGGAGQAFGEISLGIGATDIHVEGNLARAVSQVTLTGTRGGELRREERSVRFELRRWEGEWRVSAIDVAAKSEAQPEARP